MNALRNYACFPALFVLLIFIAPRAIQADTVYPARLELKEVEPGTFSVAFNLPIVNNMRLKAQPVLPPVCEDITSHKIGGTAATYTESWQMRCEARQLFGQQIRVDGLTGTQVDVILFVDMFDGRSYSAVLKPGKAVFVVPRPPSLTSLGGKASVSGMRKMLRSPEILLLVFFITSLAIDRRSLLIALLAFVMAHGTGQSLAQQQWLLLSPYVAPVFVSLITVVLSLKRMQDEKSALNLIQPLWLLTIFLGFLYGGTNPETLPVAGLSDMEKRLAFAGFNVGIGAGLLLAYFLFAEFQKILQLSDWSSRLETARTIAINISGTLAVAIFLYRMSAFLFFPSIVPEVPSEFFVTAIVFGIWVGTLRPYPGGRAFAILIILLLAGTTLGLVGLPLPLGSFVVLGSLFFFGFGLAFRYTLAQKISFSVACLAMLYQSWHVSFFIQENLSRPIGNAVGAVVLAIVAGYFCYKLASGSVTVPVSKGIRLVGLGAAFIAIIFRGQVYLQWFDNTVATELALGLVRVPLLSLAFLIIGLLLWPRRRKVHQHLNLKLKKPIAHITLLIVAFFVLPLGTLKVKNLFFVPDAPREAQARRILQQVLSKTYNAFNEQDEKQLYDQLSQNVSGDLVADLYLDSRRRLTAGVRQGAQVTIKDVSVLSVGDVVSGINAAEGFSYDCKWVVTARVKHLQHVHHRQNIYSGTLTIKVNDARWKLDRVALRSEDRVVIPWRAG